eukprot:2364678-Rhodomonas_salina.2
MKDGTVLIDGAHGLGATDLDLSRIGAEYYAGNCHKWFCAPRGVGFLYVNHQRLLDLAPLDWVGGWQSCSSSFSPLSCLLTLPRPPHPPPPPHPLFRAWVVCLSACQRVRLRLSRRWRAKLRSGYHSSRWLTCLECDCAGCSEGGEGDSLR